MREFIVGWLIGFFLMYCIFVVAIVPVVRSKGFDKGHCWGSCSAQGFTRGEVKNEECVCINETVRE